MPESCGTGTGAEGADTAAVQSAGVDLVNPRRCFARRPEGFSKAGVGVEGGAGSTSVGDGVCRVREWLRRDLGAGTAGDTEGVTAGALASALERRPRGLEGVSCSSSDVGRERGFFTDRGSGLDAELGWKTSAARAGVVAGTGLRARTDWERRGDAARGLERVIMPGVARVVLAEEGAGRGREAGRKAGRRGACCTATADIGMNQE